VDEGRYPDRTLPTDPEAPVVVAAEGGAGLWAAYFQCGYKGACTWLEVGWGGPHLELVGLALSSAQSTFSCPVDAGSGL
jgi:hypothetical protein